MDPDPSVAFFPDIKEGELDLYAVLGLTKSANESEIKSAYRRLALQTHPDKVPSGATPEVAQAAHERFQQVGYAYNVLKDEARRKRYDQTGRTDEGGSAKTEDEWKEYFKELWKGEVSAKTIGEFKAKYQGSEEELEDLYAAYDECSGDLEAMVTHIMCSTIDDEPRFISLIDDAIKEGRIKSTKKWVKTSKDTKARQKRAEKAGKEATEAEAYAKELGVHDQLYGDKKGKKEGKKGGKKGEEDHLDGLKALIQGRQANRMESLMESLEAKYGGGDGGKKAAGKGKKRASNGVEDEDEDVDGGKRRKKKVVEIEPSEEEFEKARAAMEARRTAKKAK